jgi:hypothetical protein
MSFPFKEGKGAAREEAQGLVDKWARFSPKLPEKTLLASLWLGRACRASLQFLIFWSVSAATHVGVGHHFRRHG